MKEEAVEVKSQQAKGIIYLFVIIKTNISPEGRCIQEHYNEEF